MQVNSTSAMAGSATNCLQYNQSNIRDVKMCIYVSVVFMAETN